MIPWKELQQKPKEELTNLIREWKEELRVLKFSAGQGQLKDVRAIRELRKHIAQGLTLMRR